MGALHAGHESIIRQGVELAAHRGWAGGCAVTIFVNPTQFNDPDDFDRYPRTLDADLEVCQRAGAAVAIAPSTPTVYPPGKPVDVPRLPAVATTPRLEDAARPGHFEGVCQVVRRLFELTRPGAAVFGEKDWQQLQVIRAMNDSLAMGIEIVPAPTVREADGLALSSRNRFLGPQDRGRASALFRALRGAAAIDDPAVAESQMKRTLAEASIEADYAVVRESRTLVRNPGDYPPARGAWRALIAARVGIVRLLDNVAWPG